MSFIPGFIGSFFKKAPSIISEWAGETEAKERIPKWDIPKLYDKAAKFWVLQQIYRAIIMEVKRPGGTVQPRFLSKCEGCSKEFPAPYDKCPECGSTNMRKPDSKQLRKALDLIERPNKQRQDWWTIIGSLVYHDLVADDYYLSVGYAEVMQKNPINPDELWGSGTYIPAEIFVEHPSFFRLYSDDRGRLGKNEWFCPLCYPETDETGDYDKPGQCPICGGERVKTAYIEKVGGKIRNRFGVNQVTHGSTHRVLPYLYGNPRLVSLWETVWSMSAMDNWFFDTWQTGKLAMIIDFKGYDPDQVKAMRIKMREQEAMLDQIDATTGEARRKRTTRNVFIGSQNGIAVHNVMHDPEKMQALDKYMLGIQACCGVYGVQPIMISWIEKGKSGNTPFLQIEVNNRTTKEIQNGLETVISTQLFPIFGVYDYVYKFGDLEKKDALQEANIGKIRAETVLLWRHAGFGVKLDPEGRMILSNTPVQQPARPPGDKPEDARGQKESQATGAVINDTSTERWPHGPTGDPDKNKKNPGGMVV